MANAEKKKKYEVYFSKSNKLEKVAEENNPMMDVASSGNKFFF